MVALAGALAFEAYFAAVEDTLAFADTGDIERDLTAQLHSFVGLLTAPATGHVIAQLVGASQTDPALADALAEHYTHPRRRLAVDRLTRAQRAGQIRAEVDPQVVVDQLWGACYHRLLLPDEPLDTAFADALIGNLLRGIRGVRPLRVRARTVSTADVAEVARTPRPIAAGASRRAAAYWEARVFPIVSATAAAWMSRPVRLGWTYQGSLMPENSASDVSSIAPMPRRAPSHAVLEPVWL